MNIYVVFDKPSGEADRVAAQRWVGGREVIEIRSGERREIVREAGPQPNRPLTCAVPTDHPSPCQGEPVQTLGGATACAVVKGRCEPYGIYEPQQERCHEILTPDPGFECLQTTL